MTRLVYPSDDRRAAGSTTAMQIFAASDRAQLRADNLELRARRRGDARSIIQFGFGGPKSEVARMDFSVDDDD